MLVFIDESGDPGFKVDKGSTPVFVAAMAIFANPADASVTETVIRAAQKRLRAYPEFKFNKCRAAVRDGFFEAVQPCPFRVRAIVVRKAAIYSPHLKTDKEDFYRFFVRQMMANDGGSLDQARVIIDGSGDREFKKTLATYLRRQLGDRLKDLRLSDSRRDVLVQLADMCAGAIARSCRADRADAQRWRTMLRPKIDNVWNFE